MSKFGTNSLYYLIRFVRLVVRFRTTNPNLLHEELDKLVQKNATYLDMDRLGEILGIEDLRKILYYFLDYGAATSLILQQRLKLNASKVYRRIIILKDLDIIEPAVRIPSKLRSKGGPRATIYKVPDADIAQINDAINLHRKLLSPKYRIAEELAQILLEEYIEPKGLKEITKREILVFLKEKKLRERGDVAELMARYLQHQRGIKVWR